MTQYVPYALTLFAALGGVAQATQVVFIDFDSRTSYLDLRDNLGYSAFERNQIVSRVREDYEMFDFEFVTTAPQSGEYSTVFLNDGQAFGLAQQIDFRNINKTDTATVNVPFSSARTDYNRVLLTSTVISHELGHILGLRHADAFGPIGLGINANSFAVQGFEFPGPMGARESEYHIMQTDPDNGVPFETFFGEREAVKLAFNERGTVVNEMRTGVDNDAASTAEPITLTPLSVPNTIRSGQFRGQDFTVNAVTVLGALSGGADDGFDAVDYYSFEARAGDVLFAEAISSIQQFDVDSEPLGRYTDTIAPRVTVYDQDGNAVDYFGGPAGNDLGPESIDAVIFDLLIPEDGTYLIAVDGAGAGGSDATPDEGSYELLLYTFGVDSGVRATSAGDYNGDGVVNAADYTVFRDSFASTTTVGSAADGNANGMVDPEDYRYWLGNFGAVRSAAAVPEPAGALLLAIAAAAAWRRRAA